MCNSWKSIFIFFCLGLILMTLEIQAQRSRSSQSDTSVRFSKLETELGELSNQVQNLEDKVEAIAIDRWCEKTVGCYLDLNSGALSFTGIPDLPIIYPGIPNELRSKIKILNIIGVVIDTDFLIANLDGLQTIETIVLGNIDWIGDFSQKRAYLPNLRKFSITSPRFTPDNQFLEGNNLKDILFFDKRNDSVGKDWNLDQVHRLGVDINVHGQFIIEHGTGTITSYKRSIEPLLNNIKSSSSPSVSSDNPDFFNLKYLYLSNYNLTASTKLPPSIQYLGMNSVLILGSRDLNGIVKQLPNLQVLDVSFVKVAGNEQFKFDISSLAPASLKTLKFGSIKIMQSKSSSSFANLQTIRWFNTQFESGFLDSFSTTFKNVVNAFVLTDDKTTQYKLLKLLIQETNVENVIMPEFKYDNEIKESDDEIETFFNQIGLTANDSLIAATKIEGSWEKGSKFNFWRD